jgi:hypothetical protein
MPGSKPDIWLQFFSIKTHIIFLSQYIPTTLYLDLTLTFLGSHIWYTKKACLALQNTYGLWPLLITSLVPVLFWATIIHHINYCSSNFCYCCPYNQFFGFFFKRKSDNDVFCSKPFNAASHFPVSKTGRICTGLQDKCVLILGQLPHVFFYHSCAFMYFVPATFASSNPLTISYALVFPEGILFPHGCFTFFI